MTEFADITALVTGGASGIGAATASVLAARGATVFTLDRESATQVGAVRSVVADVTDDAAVTRAVEEVVAATGSLDVLVNNAGIGAVGTVEDNDLDEWRRVIDINLIGIVRCTRAALPHLRRSAAPVVVNTCSVAATTGLPRRALYSATKGAVQSLTLAMAADYVGEGIRVCAVNPGTVDTPWVRRLLDNADDPVAERAALERRQPAGRLIMADEVAQAIAYLAGPHAGAATGVILPVDGGMAALRVPPAPSRH